MLAMPLPNHLYNTTLNIAFNIGSGQMQILVRIVVGTCQILVLTENTYYYFQVKVSRLVLEFTV